MPDICEDGLSAVPVSAGVVFVCGIAGSCCRKSCAGFHTICAAALGPGLSLQHCLFNLIREDLFVPGVDASRTMVSNRYCCASIGSEFTNLVVRT